MRRLLTMALLAGLTPILVACSDEPLGTAPSSGQDAQSVATQETPQAPAEQAPVPTLTPEPTPTVPQAPTASQTPTSTPAEAAPSPAAPEPTVASPPPPPPSTPAPQPTVTPASTVTPTPTVAPAPTVAPEPEPAVTPEAVFLEVTSPEDESTVDTSPVTVAGKTTPDAVLSINGESVEVDADGMFTVEVKLVEGINFIEIVTSDFGGNTAEAVRTLIYSPASGQ